MSSINSKTEISDVYHRVIQDVIKNMRGVFKEENVSHFVLRDLESVWTRKFLKMRQKSIPLTLVPMKIMVPYKKTPTSSNRHIREIELMVPHHEAELLDFRTIFSEDIIEAALNLSDGSATMFLQQRVNNFLVSKKQVEDVIFPQDAEKVEQDPLVDDVVVKPEQAHPSNAANEAPKCEDECYVIPQLDGGNGSSDDDDDESSSDGDSSSQKGQEDARSSGGSDGETLNTDDDVTDEDIETLFDCDNVILCQYLKVIRCKNIWRFYFKDGVMNLNGTDHAFHKIFGGAPW